MKYQVGNFEIGYEMYMNIFPCRGKAAHMTVYLAPI